jgi:hypothetical protein
MVAQQSHRFSPAAHQAFREYIELRMGQPRFANARSVRNAIDRMRLRQANRLLASAAMVGKDDLVRLEADDIRLSRVFGQAAAGTGPPR